MEEILKESEKIYDKIKLIESFISLHLRRDSIEPQIQELINKTDEVKSLIQQCNQVMKSEYTIAMKEYEILMQKMQVQQLQVLEYLIEKRKSEKLNLSNGNCDRSRQRYPSAGPQVNVTDTNQQSHLKSIQNGAAETRMYLDEYLQSPFVRKTKPLPVPFQFMDFEAEITPQMFESIPKYMKGRETVEELKNFLDTVLVPCFNEKYQLLHRHRDCIRNHVDLDMWKVYKDQASYFPGQNFITQGDISRKIKKMLDKKSQNKITMLRHLGILQEQRKAQTVCYIWTASNF